MPRQRDVVMNPKNHTPQQLHDAAIKRTIKLYRPFEVIAGELAGTDKDKYAVVYTAPKGGDRCVLAEHRKRSKAASLRDMLAVAWAEGHWASGRG